MQFIKFLGDDEKQVAINKNNIKHIMELENGTMIILIDGYTYFVSDKFEKVVAKCNAEIVRFQDL